MNNRLIKSFRFEIVLYSLLSLLYTIITMALVVMGMYLLRNRHWEIERQELPLYVGMIICIGIALFILYFLLLTKKFVTYIRVISEGIQQISMGNLDNRIVIRNGDEFALIANQLNKMAVDIRILMDNERRSEQAKNELITSVAHDLRTPLTSILGYLDLVSTKELSEDIKKQYIEIAYNKSRRLEKLIDDLFTYTKFNFGEVKPQYREMNVVKLIDQLLDEFYPSFSENGLEYEFITNHPNVMIMADGDLLARAIANLISNAIKYGKDGKKVRIELKNESKVEIKIINYGHMIPKDDLQLIFQRFYRVESSRSSETGGSGLGLAIAESIIHIHGGTVFAESNEKNTCFTVIL